MSRFGVDLPSCLSRRGGKFKSSFFGDFRYVKLTIIFIFHISQTFISQLRVCRPSDRCVYVDQNAVNFASKALCLLVNIYPSVLTHNFSPFYAHQLVLFICIFLMSAFGSLCYEYWIIYLSLN